MSDFFIAVAAGDSEKVSALLEADPDLVATWQRTDYGGRESALHVAAKKGDLAMSRLLVESGAEIYALRQADYPPVFEAHYSGNKDLVAYLLEASEKTDDGLPPTYGCGIDLVLATRTNMIDRVRRHLAKDPFAVFRRGCIGETVLHWPGHNGYVEVLEELIAAGAQIEADAIGLYGGKPLHWAAEHAPACVSALLSHGANPNARNLAPGEFEGFTPLHMCASQPNQCVENVDLLLEAGAELGARDARNETPLDVARRCDRPKMVEHLLAKR